MAAIHSSLWVCLYCCAVSITATWMYQYVVSDLLHVILKVAQSFVRRISKVCKFIVYILHFNRGSLRQVGCHYWSPLKNASCLAVSGLWSEKSMMQLSAPLYQSAGFMAHITHLCWCVLCRGGMVHCYNVSQCFIFSSFLTLLKCKKRTLHSILCSALQCAVLICNDMYCEA